MQCTDTVVPSRCVFGNGVSINVWSLLSKLYTHFFFSPHVLYDFPCPYYVSHYITGCRTDEVTGEWRTLHNEELNDLYSSLNTVRVIKSRRMRWAGHVARMGEERGCVGSWWGNRRERDHWGDLGIDGWIILGRISRRWDVGIWTGLG